MNIKFRAYGPRQSVRVDHEYVGTVKTYSSGSRFVFTPNLVLEDNFSSVQYAEIRKAVADKITTLEVARRLTS